MREQEIPKPFIEVGDDDWSNGEEQEPKPIMSAEEQAEYDADYQRFLERHRRDQ